MLKTVNQHIFNVVAGFAIAVTAFYLAAITHILPLPKSVSSRIEEFALASMDVLLACVVWLISLLSALFSSS